jgi:hypothetical protein
MLILQMSNLTASAFRICELSFWLMGGFECVWHMPEVLLCRFRYCCCDLGVGYEGGFAARVLQAWKCLDRTLSVKYWMIFS